MKWVIAPALLVIILSAIIGCKKNDSNPTGSNAVATEEWAFVMNSDSTNHGQATFEKQADGTITSKATWYFVYQGSTVVCPFESSNVTVMDTAIAVVGQGTATNPGAPAGYQTSPLSINVVGSALNGQSSGNWTITFTTVGWPSPMQGTYTATRKTGSGITK